jgi:hypothetical protein
MTYLTFSITTIAMLIVFAVDTVQKRHRHS